MKVTGRTILITGGTSGIGQELARRFLELGNTVVVTGRDSKKLDETRKLFPKIHAIQSDVSDRKALVQLREKITREFPELDVVINNAGVMKKQNLHEEVALDELTREIEINLMGPIWLTKEFLAHLKSKPSAAIINVSSGLAFIPLPISPVYCATKAAMHSFTQSLRIQLKNTKIEVIELAPPAVETPLFRGDFTADDLGGTKGMDLKVFGESVINSLKKGTLEIRPGLSNMLKMMSRIAPEFMTNQLGKTADKMLAQTRH